MTSSIPRSRSIQGAGVGLRTPHLPLILEQQPDIPWFELLADNWLAEGGLDKRLLHQIAERYPITLHGVNLSLGSLDPLNLEYLAKIKRLKQETQATWYSEHCSFSSFDGQRTPDLLPMPHTEEAIQHLVDRIHQVQDFLQERILIENISSYVACNYSEHSEAEFIAETLKRSDCDLLLDINNLYVNSINNGFDCHAYLQQLPIDRVKQVHLSGHQQNDGFLLDTHGSQINKQVWQLYQDFLELAGPIPTLIEWDHDVPEWSKLESERLLACQFLDTQQVKKNRANDKAAIKEISA
ncbi:MAG: DUF692 domain-containing protein [Pseudomonadales bacterium]|nr:DUF692 domain-containing protein [Pseudomonadales bacterium]